MFLLSIHDLIYRQIDFDRRFSFYTKYDIIDESSAACAGKACSGEKRNRMLKRAYAGL